MPKVKIIVSILFVCFFINNELVGQVGNNIIEKDHSQYFVDIYAGIQISGIRKEDFVSSNIASYTQLSVGKWITPSIAFAIGYQGTYFRFIGDQVKHKYSYANGELIFNLNSIFFKNKPSDIWKFNIIIGSGYFYNYLYKRPNICATLGFTNEFKIINKLSLKFKLSSIFGWDIYQGDEDILTNYSIGITKYF